MTKYNPWKPPFPTGSLYWDEEDREETFRTHDHPMAFYDLSSEEQESLLEWTKQLKKIKSFNNRNTSYGIKHLFEGSGNGFYIYNGAMITSTTNAHVGTDSELVVQNKGLSGIYRDIRCAKVIESSHEDRKKDISIWDKKVLPILKTK